MSVIIIKNVLMLLDSAGVGLAGVRVILMARPDDWRGTSPQTRQEGTSVWSAPWLVSGSSRTYWREEGQPPAGTLAPILPQYSDTADILPRYWHSRHPPPVLTQQTSSPRYWHSRQQAADTAKEPVRPRPCLQPSIPHKTPWIIHSSSASDNILYFFWVMYDSDNVSSPTPLMWQRWVLVIVALNNKNKKVHYCNKVK